MVQLLFCYKILVILCVCFSDGVPIPLGVLGEMFDLIEIHTESSINTFYSLSDKKFDFFVFSMNNIFWVPIRFTSFVIQTTVVLWRTYGN